MNEIIEAATKINNHYYKRRMEKQGFPTATLQYTLYKGKTNKGNSSKWKPNPMQVNTTQKLYITLYKRDKTLTPKEKEDFKKNNKCFEYRLPSHFASLHFKNSIPEQGEGRTRGNRGDRGDREGQQAVALIRNNLNCETQQYIILENNLLTLNNFLNQSLIPSPALLVAWKGLEEINIEITILDLENESNSKSDNEELVTQTAIESNESTGVLYK